MKERISNYTIRCGESEGCKVTCLKHEGLVFLPSFCYLIDRATRIDGYLRRYYYEAGGKLHETIGLPPEQYLP